MYQLGHIYDDGSLMSHIEDLRPTIGFIISNLESIKSEIKGMEEGGDLFKERGLGYPGKSSHFSSIESSIITINEGKRIVGVVEKGIYSLRSDLFDVMVSYYWDNWAQPRVACKFKISERTLRRRIQEIQDHVVEVLDEDKVNFYTVYWFREKFDYVKRFEKVS